MPFLYPFLPKGPIFGYEKWPKADKKDRMSTHEMARMNIRHLMISHDKVNCATLEKYYPHELVRVL